MTLDGSYTATIDRIVGGYAVVLVEGEDGPIEELHLDPDELPEGGDGEGDVLQLEFEDGELVDVAAKPDERDERLAEARDRFERLAERPPKKDE